MSREGSSRSVSRPQLAVESEGDSAGLRSFSYPAGTPGFDGPGFYFTLSSSQRSLLRELRSWLREEVIAPEVLNAHALHPDLTLLRYLRANKFDFEKTCQHISRNALWREESAVNGLLELDPEQVLGCTMEEMQTYLPHWHCGFDKTGRPVIYKQYGFFENALLLEVSSIESVTRYHVWEQEAISKLCEEQSRRTGLIVETSFAMMDLEGMQMRQVTRDFLALVKAFANIDQAQYPETLGKLLIINAPSAFPFVWSWVKPWLDPVVAGKIQIFGAESSWAPVLFDLIGRENMPENYGGLLPRLTTKMHPYKGFEKGLPPGASPSELCGRGSLRRSSSQGDRRACFRRTPSLALEPSRSGMSDSGGVSAGMERLESRNRQSVGLSRILSGRHFVAAGARESGRFPDESVLRYPDNTPGKDSPDGYVFSLTVAQAGALKAVQQWMQDNHLDINALVCQALHPNLVLLRYLRANKFDIENAIAHMKRNIVWRREQGVDQLVQQRPDEILGCPLRDYMNYLPHWHCGYDKTGRPVIYKQYGFYENDLLRDCCDLSGVTRYHIWEQEMTARLCYMQSRRTGHIVETSFAIMDLEGMQLRQVTSEFLSIVKAFASIDQAQYPETLGRLLIINAPSAFPWVWRGVKTFLDPVVASKIQIFGGENTWKPILYELIGKENVPENYGGDLPRLLVGQNPYPVAYTPPHENTEQTNDIEEDDNESVNSSVFYDAVEQQEVRDISRVLSQRENFIRKAAMSSFVIDTLVKMPLRLLSHIFFYSLITYLVVTFTAMVLSSYALNTGPMSDNAFNEEKWTLAIIVILSFFLFVVIFIGYVGNLIKNFRLLNFFAGSVAVGSFLYGVVSAAAFTYYGLDVSNSTMKAYRLVIAIGCLFLFLFGLVSIAISRSLAYRSSLETDKRLQPQQLRVVIRTLSIVCVFFAIGMVSYGGTCMHFLYEMQLQISSTVYSIFALIYCGVTMMLSGLCGFWVSVTTRRNVVFFYFRVFIPLMMALLLAASIASFANLGNMSRYGDSAYGDATTRSEVGTDLLMSGVLNLFCCVFHFIAAHFARRLWIKMDEDFAADEGNARFKYANTLTVRKRTAHRRWQESFVIAYGLIGGLFCVYFKGTFIVFADFVQSDKSTYSLSWLSNPFYGETDPRYSNFDPYIVASDGTLALFVGPLMLLYSWSTFVRAPFRHLIGVLVNTSIIFNTFVFYGIEILRNFDDIRSSNQGVFAITMVLDLSVGLLLPMIVLIYESAIVSRNSGKAYSQEFNKKVRAGRLSIIRSNGQMSAIRSRGMSGGGRSRGNSHLKLRRISPPSSPSSPTSNYRDRGFSLFSSKGARISETAPRTPEDEDVDFSMTI